MSQKESYEACGRTARYHRRKQRQPRKFLNGKDLTPMKEIREWLREQEAWDSLEDWPEPEDGEFDLDDDWEPDWDAPTSQESHEQAYNDKYGVGGSHS